MYDTHHLPITRFLVDSGHVGPVEELDEFHHGFSLVLVGWNGPHEEWKPVFRTQRWTCGEEAHLQL